MQESRVLTNGRMPNITNRVLGAGSAIGFGLAITSEVVTQKFDLLAMLYIFGAMFGSYSAMFSAIPHDSVVRLRRCNYEDSPSSYYEINARRFLASTALASYLIMFAAKMADNPVLIPAGAAMAVAAIINNAALGVPRRDETGYILFGLFGGITSAGLLINDMTNPPTAQAVILGIANAILFTMCVASVAINVKRHEVAISEAQGFKAKAKALLCGKQVVESVGV